MKLNGHDVEIFLQEKEPIDYRFVKACVAEFIAMFFFIMIGMGAAMGEFRNIDSYHNNNEIAMCVGFGILVLAQFAGPLSGGHMNCAVSFGLFTAGRISGVRLIAYTLSQMLGSVCGAFGLYCVFGNHWEGNAAAFGANAWDPGTFTVGAVFMAEAVCTGLLIINVLATIDIPTEGGGVLGVLPIAMTVMYAHYLLLPITGCSINPTRSFGSSIVASLAGIHGNHERQLYMFWIAPLTGALVGAVLYEYGALKPRLRDVKGKNMQDGVFRSNSVPPIHPTEVTDFSPMDKKGTQAVSSAEKSCTPVTHIAPGTDALLEDDEHV